MSDLQRLKKRAKPRQRTVKLCLDGDLSNEWGRLADAYDAAVRADARENRNPEAPALAEQMDALRDRMDAETEPFTLAQIGYQAWTDLMIESPPTDAQIERKLDHDPAAFQPKAIAASLVTPDLDDGEFADLLPLLTAEQVGKLWDACQAVNTGDNRIPFSAVDFANQLSSKPKSTTAPSGESPAASS